MCVMENIKPSVYNLLLKVTLCKTSFMSGRREKHKVCSEGGANTSGGLTNARQAEVTFGDATGD